MIRTFELSRQNIATGFPLSLKYYIGRDGLPSDALRGRIKVWAWKYRQASKTQGASGSTGGGGGHIHPDISVTIPADAVTVTSTSAQPTMTDTVDAHVLTEAEMPGHTHTNPATNPEMAEDIAPNANLDITLDGDSFKTGLGDGTEKLLVDEALDPKYLSAGEHTMTLSCGANGAVEILLIIEE